MEKNIPNIEALQKFLEDEANRSFRSPILPMSPSMRRHMEIIERFKSFTLVSAWPELNLPKGSQIAIREKDDDTVAPYMVVLSDMTKAFQKSDIRKARRSLIDEQDTFDHLILTNEEWAELVDRENANIDTIPAPFYHEALKNFVIRDYNDNEVLPFRRSQLPRIKCNGYDILPLVDTLLASDNGQTQLFCIGLVGEEDDNIYQVGLFWFGDVPSEYHDTIVEIIYGYFYAQFAFHVCPERIIEVKPDDPDPFEEVDISPRPQSSAPRKPGRTTIARKIYIRDYPQSRKGRGINRQCRCWYVHGFMRTCKSGKQVWIEGYFKGPDRNNPAARQHTKDYVMT